MSEGLVGAVLDGRYKVIEPIAEGAMGCVYRAERLKLGRAVAIKLMHEELPDQLSSRERFEREAKLMALLEHPHCVSVIDFGVHDGKPFLVMDLVRGTSLLDVIARSGALDVPRAAELTRQILSGLAHAHELGIIHRDIKPANLMLTTTTGLGEQIRILDFGLARPTEPTSTKLTTGIAVGTPNYMAPEQCQGQQVDERTDLYAVGVVLFEMLTGKKPFLADDPVAVVRKHMKDPPPTLAAVAPGDYGDFEAVVACALAKAPADRYASAHDMSAAIDAALASRKSFGHAVPQAIGPAASKPQVATASGWNVPEPSVPVTEPVAGSFSAAASGVLAAVTDSSPPPSPLSPPSPPSTPSSPSPPSRPARPGASLPPALRRFLSTLPFSPRQLTIIGGVLGAILVIGIIASLRHTEQHFAPPADAAVRAPPPADAAPALDPGARALADATRLLDAGDNDAALSTALAGLRDAPNNAQLAALAGRLYFDKLYWRDGIRYFRDAIRHDPQLSADPDVVKAVVRGFNTTPDVDDDIERFLREDVGSAAVPYLEETARKHPNAKIRARAEAELRRIH